MRHVFSTLFDTVAQHLYGEPPAGDPASLLPIRAGMLALLPPDRDAPADAPVRRLRQRLLVAHDAQALWFLRAELNQLLCHRVGERQAFERVAGLTPLFQGAVRPALLAPLRRRHATPAARARTTLTR